MASYSLKASENSKSYAASTYIASFYSTYSDLLRQERFRDLFDNAVNFIHSGDTKNIEEGIKRLEGLEYLLVREDARLNDFAVWRGANFNDIPKLISFLEEMMHNGLHSEKPFLSTSTDYNVAKKFAMGTDSMVSAGPYYVIFKISIRDKDGRELPSIKVNRSDPEREDYEGPSYVQEKELRLCTPIDIYQIKYIEIGKNTGRNLNKIFEFSENLTRENLQSLISSLLKPIELKAYAPI